MKDKYKKLIVVSAFTAGVLLGWIVLGWWLLPVKEATATNDFQDDQQRLMRLLAEDYWESGNLSHVRSSLKGWDRKELAKLLRKMEQETSDPEEQRQLARLRSDLVLPSPDFTLADLYRKPRIGWSLNISLGLMLAAAVIRFWPTEWELSLAWFRKAADSAAKDAVDVAPAQDQPHKQADDGLGANNATAKGNAAAKDGEALDSPSQIENTERDRGEPGKHDAQTSKGKYDSILENETAEKDSERIEKKVNKKEEESHNYAVREVEDEQSAYQVSSVGTDGEEIAVESVEEREGAREGLSQDRQVSADSREGASQQAERKETHAERDREDDDAEELDALEDLEDSEDFDDILSSVFEEEDQTLRDLEVLSEGLDDIDIKDLAIEAKNISRGLREVNRSI